MNIVSSPTLSNEIKTRIHISELLTAFEQYADKIKILSLDCFDTILWRKVAEPTDVFYDLAQRPAFKSIHFSALMRTECETLAYQKMQVKNGGLQVKLKDIYLAAFPHLTDEQLNALEEDELSAEIDTCYALPSIIKLMRNAHAHGIKITITSDTYLDEKQLRRLLASHLPQDVMASINHIFCSCEAGRSKSYGLFQHVIQQLQTNSSSILHIGDNAIADFEAPRKLGINALLLAYRHDDKLAELLRMQANAASLFDPTIRQSRSLPSPFHSLLASYSTTQNAESIIGYTTIGPIIFAFAKFILAEIEQLSQENKHVKVIFLMRDAYLPALACEKIAGHPIGKNIRVSRFTAIAASFRTREDIDNYLAKNAKSCRFQDMCTQFQLPENITSKIIEITAKSNNPVLQFIQLIQQEEIVKVILTQSRINCEKLIKYLQQEAELESGDTVIFVDLGYSGTTQTLLAPLLKDTLNIDVIGRYLIAMPIPGWQHSRAGLLDPSRYDDKALVMLVTYISLFEQICTANENSTINFDAHGNPIYSDITVNNDQHQKRHAIQTECLRFIHDVTQFTHETNIQISKNILQDVAAINLCRFIFFPLEIETHYLDAFQHDISLGTHEVLPIFDLKKGLTSLRKRTWLYSTKENINNMRLNYPTEWRATNLELSLALLAQYRFGLKFAANDLSQRREPIQIISAQGKQTSALMLKATPTHDGYFSLLIPIMSGNQVGIQFGTPYHWVEVDSAELIPLIYLYSDKEYENTKDANSCFSAHQMTGHSGGLFECLDHSSMLIFIPPDNIGNQQHILRVIFRPIVMRS